MQGCLTAPRVEAEAVHAAVASQWKASTGFALLDQHACKKARLDRQSGAVEHEHHPSRRFWKCGENAVLPGPAASTHTRFGLCVFSGPGF